jgi:hypothetical protein
MSSASRSLYATIAAHDPSAEAYSRRIRRVRSRASRSGSPIATYTSGGRTRPARFRSISGMPTVSTVESTTSARFARCNDASTVAKSPP